MLIYQPHQNPGNCTLRVSFFDEDTNKLATLVTHLLWIMNSYRKKKLHGIDS